MDIKKYNVTELDSKEMITVDGGWFPGKYSIFLPMTLLRQAVLLTAGAVAGVIGYKLITK